MSTQIWESSSELFLSRRRGLDICPFFSEGDLLLDGRYVIQKALGSGGFGMVYCALDNLRRQHIALKVAEAGSCDPRVARRVLEHEFRVYARVGPHPNLIEVYDIHYAPWRNTGFLIMAMELVGGGSLRDWLMAHQEQRDIRLSQGKKLIIQACRALSAAHHAGVTHRDVKPENLLITLDGVIKLSDFGAAHCLQTFQLSTSGVRRSSLRLGTPTYMSPEMFVTAHPQEVGPSTDIYAMGCVMYEMFSKECRPPFSGNHQELRECHLHSPAPELRDIDPRLAAIVARCLEKSISRRSSAVELLEHSRAVDTGQWSRRPDTHVRKHQEEWQRR